MSNERRPEREPNILVDSVRICVSSSASADIAQQTNCSGNLYGAGKCSLRATDSAGKYIYIKSQFLDIRVSICL